MSLDTLLGTIEQSINQISATLGDFKNCVQTLRPQKAQQIDSLLQQQEKCFVEYKELLRQTPVVPSATRQKHKQLYEQFQSLRAEYQSTKQKQTQKPTNEVQIRAANVSNQYSDQTNQLKDINRKVEESVQRIQLSNQQILNQDEQLQRVGDKFTHIQSKASNAGQLVNNMRKKENRSTNVLKVFFIFLSLSNSILIIIFATKGVHKQMNSVSNSNVAKSFIPKILDVKDANGGRELKINYWRQWI
ncbi:Hypothetical_protein [Hexamita inflata]|uniref:Hypothetical_protein n=1 Tax=Hexamita inflata TaxID=28002 RepID=A0AA86UNN2_9EUKA|nr:Hypothetical protein HINF_LOCUS265 [Hexamita inflata]CAI9965515.1 Hypothetical protein HINF_LOCUS53160 [Hexamita inflata]